MIHDYITIRINYEDQINFLNKGGDVAGFLQQRRQGGPAVTPAAPAAIPPAQPAGANQIGRFTIETVPEQ